MFLGARWLDEVVGMNLALEIACWVLTVGRGHIIERIGGDVGWAAVPVRVSVHEGEGKVTNGQTVFISARFHFPEL